MFVIEFTMFRRTAIRKQTLVRLSSIPQTVYVHMGTSRFPSNRPYFIIYFNTSSEQSQTTRELPFRLAELPCIGTLRPSEKQTFTLDRRRYLVPSLCCIKQYPLHRALKRYRELCATLWIGWEKFQLPYGNGFPSPQAH